METKLMVSLNDGIAALSPENMVVCHAPLEGAGALCAGNACIFCADESGAIWRFCRKTMMPAALCCGGPGICDLKLSDCQTRLYALLGEADCVLMSDARSGRAIAVNHCGCNPRCMACCKGLLAVAGGESGCVHLFHGHTLENLGEISMPGPVYSVALCADAVCALCLTAQLNTLLAVWKENNLAVYPLPGMPGGLFAAGNCLYIATAGNLYMHSLATGTMMLRRSAPGRASRMIAAQAQLILYDPLSECVFSSACNGSWQRILCGVKDICLP